MNIVGLLWTCVGATLCVALGSFAMKTQAYKAPPDVTIGSITKAAGVEVRHSGSTAWQVLGVNDVLRPGDVVATDEKGALLDLELGRALQLGGKTVVNLVGVARSGGIHDIQVQLMQGYVEASQPRQCRPCGVLIVIAGGSSYEVRRGETAAVRINDKGEAVRMGKQARLARDKADATHELRVSFLDKREPVLYVSAGRDPVFGREWWTDRKPSELRFASLSLPIRAPIDRPSLANWKPFVEVWGADDLAPRKTLATTKSLTPALNLRAPDLFALASSYRDQGIQSYRFHMRGGAEVRLPSGGVERNLQPGVSEYSVSVLGEPATSELPVGGVVLGLDKLASKPGPTWFPAKPWLDPRKARYQVWLPPGEPLGTLGNFIRGASAVGWTNADYVFAPQSTVLLERGRIAAIVAGDNADAKELNLLRRALRADTVVRAGLDDFVQGTPEAVAKEIWEPLQKKTPYFVAGAGVVRPLEASRFRSTEDLERFLRSSGQTVLKREVPVLRL